MYAVGRKVELINLVTSSDEEDTDQQEPSDLEAEEEAASAEVPTPAQAERQIAAAGGRSNQEKEEKSDEDTEAATGAAEGLQEAERARSIEQQIAGALRRNPSRKGRPEGEGQLSLNHLQAQG